MNSVEELLKTLMPIVTIGEEKTMNLRFKPFFTAALVALGVASAPALSQQETGWYAGLSVGQSKAKDACTGTAFTGITCDDSDTAFSIFGGYQVNRNLGLELGYVDLGEATASGLGATASAKSKGFELLGVGTYPINQQFDVYGKLGFFRWDLDLSASGPGGSISLSESGTDLTYGFGVKYSFTKNVGMRVQWQRYNDIGKEATTGTSDVDVISVGVVFKF